MSFEMVIFTAVFVLLGASLLVQPRLPRAFAARGSLDPELDPLVRPQLLFSTTVSVARC